MNWKHFFAREWLWLMATLLLSAVVGGYVFYTPLADPFAQFEVEPLRDIVSRMVEAGESEADIAAVIRHDADFTAAVKRSASSPHTSFNWDSLFGSFGSGAFLGLLFAYPPVILIRLTAWAIRLTLGHA